MPRKNRDYKFEYRTYHGKRTQKKRRAARNTARRHMERRGKVRRGDGKEVDHVKPLSRRGSNGEGNLRVTTRKQNRRKYNK